MKITDMPLVDRPREKLLKKGPEYLSDKELLAIILRSGTKKENAITIAEKVLHRLPQPKQPVSAELLLAIDGIDIAKACTIIAVFELGKRRFQSGNETIASVEEPGDVVRFIADIRTLKKEHFLALYLNARNQVLHKETVSIGTINASLVHPREVFEPAVRHVASAVVLAHNHPSGDPHPSEADEAVTKRLVDAGTLMGIEVVDHVIVTENGYYSFKQAGKI